MQWLKESAMNHCTFKALCLLALLFLVSSPISAQTHPCGGARAGNEVQVGEAPGGNGIAPTPLCDWVNGNQSQASQPPPERWQDNWGAIATYEPNGSLGVVTNMPSQNVAENAALSDCQSKHGSACKIKLSYRNQCAAMVVGGKDYNVNPGATLDNESPRLSWRLSGLSQAPTVAA
jgi:hypothetical protein